jgi:hypothetical protein
VENVFSLNFDKIKEYESDDFVEEKIEDTNK